MAPDIDLIVFDLDDVLGQLNRALRLQRLAEMTGRDAAFLHAAIWASDFEPSAERGAFATGAEYLSEFNRRAGAHLTREQWLQARRDATTLNTETLALADQLRGHCEVAMLTNNGSLLHECLPDLLPEVQRVFGARAYASYQFQASKPEPLVFERLRERCGVPAGRAVFIDDCEEFVVGARQVGMRGIRYTGAADLRRELQQLGLPLP